MRALLVLVASFAIGHHGHTATAAPSEPTTRQDKFGPMDAMGLTPFAAPFDVSNAVAACVRQTFDTELIRHACETGGQPEARAAMAAFVKEKKVPYACGHCHTSLGPTYDLSPVALAQFKRFGGT